MEKALAAVVALLVVVLVAVICAAGSAKSACLEAGYPGAKIDYKWNRYCIKRVEQTDVVVPLELVRK